MALFLRKTVGAWSAGTRVEVIGPMDKGLLDYIPGNVTVRVLAGDKPIIDVPESDIVRRRGEHGRDLS